jgi:hypothetical protein
MRGTNAALEEARRALRKPTRLQNESYADQNRRRHPQPRRDPPVLQGQLDLDGNVAR